MSTHLSPQPSLSAGTELGERLRALAGPDSVRPAGAEDSVSGKRAQWVVEPGSERGIASLLRFASETGLSVVPRGGGSKLSWGNPPEHADVILSLLRLNRVVEHTWADMTVTVEAGCTIGELQRALAKHGQRLALDPLWPERATVGGVLSTNDTGTLRLSYGGLRDLVIGMTLALADGTLAKSGGKVVKNVAGYDLPKLATGALGTLGIITQAVFRVHPLPAGTRTLSFQAEDLPTMQRRILDLLKSDLPCARIQACLADDAAPAVYLGLEGNEAGLAAQAAGIRELAQPIQVSPGPASTWLARQELWTPPQDGTRASLAKLSVLPSKLGETMAALHRLAEAQHARWRAVLQATGVGWMRVEAAEAAIPIAIFREMRSQIERGGGSLTVAPVPSGAGTSEAAMESSLDFWGEIGDALPVMAALKQQFDPQRTLNPGRFAGGI